MDVVWYDSAQRRALGETLIREWTFLVSNRGAILPTRYSHINPQNYRTCTMRLYAAESVRRILFFAPPAIRRPKCVVRLFGFSEGSRVRVPGIRFPKPHLAWAYWRAHFTHIQPAFRQFFFG